MIVSRYPALVALMVLAQTGCPKKLPVKAPPPPVDGARLTGVWMGTLRDQPALRAFRVVRLLYQLKAHQATGKLTGSFAFRGALSTAYRGTLLCNKKPRAELKRAANIAHGHFDRRRVTWTLGDLAVDGVKSCAFRFPMAKTCTAHALRSGGLRLRCGKLQVDLHRVAMTGVWAWDEERTDQAGDTVKKHQRFHLVQQGGDVTGFADDVRVHLSQDGQRYKCNGRLQYTQQSRFRLNGQLTGLTVRLRVVSTLRRTGPCAGKHTLPAELVGTWKPFEDRLELPLTKAGRKLRRMPGLRPVGAPLPPRPTH